MRKAQTKQVQAQEKAREAAAETMAQQNLAQQVANKAAHEAARVVSQCRSNPMEEKKTELVGQQLAHKVPESSSCQGKRSSYIQVPFPFFANAASCFDYFHKHSFLHFLINVSLSLGFGRLGNH